MSMEEKLLRCLVTGASGFVGRSLCEALEKANFQVLVTQSQTVLKDSRYSILYSGDLAQLPGDFSDKLKHVDVIFHLAGRAHKMEEAHLSLEEALPLYRTTNGEGTRRLANAAQKAGVKRFVYLSSVKAAGESTEKNQYLSSAGNEKPEDAYGISKLEAENLLQQICTTMEFVILRPPLIYGPGVKANFLKLIGLVEKTLPLPFARIENARSYLFIDNLVDALVRCGVHEKAKNRLFYVADEFPLSLTDLLKTIGQASGRRPRLFYFPRFLMWVAACIFRKQQMYSRLFGNLAVSSVLLKREMGWQPPYTTLEGLEKTLAWYKSQG